MRNVKSDSTGRLSFNFSFNSAKPFLSRYKQFWGTKFLDKCQGAFVCEYDQNYTTVIVIQPKNRNMKSDSTGRISFYFSFKFTKPFLSGSKQFWRTKILDKSQGVFVCVYDQNCALVIVTQQKKRGTSNLIRQ